MARPSRRISNLFSENGGIMTLLQPGTEAPGFSAEASDGHTYQLQELLKQHRVLLLFYPGNNTPG
jgi:peroxiredoxin